jgi:hypothetical protein
LIKNIKVLLYKSKATILLGADVKHPKAPEGMFILRWGLHKGTMMSRQAGDLLTLGSEQEVRAKWDEIKQYLDEMGWEVWFANFTDDQGEQTELTQSVPYR